MNIESSLAAYPMIGHDGTLSLGRHFEIYVHGCGVWHFRNQNSG